MTLKNAMRLIGCAAFGLVGAVGFALTQLAPAISLEQMTRDADQIILGNVLGQETKIVKNNFETDYKIQVAQNLKSRDGSMQPGETVTITLPGGVLDSPPLTQYIMGQPSMYKGQEVALFLRAGTAAPAPQNSRAGEPVSTLRSSYKIIGLSQGYFNVVTRADTGEKVVARINLENYGIVNSAAGVKEVEKAISEKQVPTVNKNITRQDDAAADAHSKDPLEMTSQDGKKLVTESRMQAAELQKILRTNGAVPVQSLDTFTSQINSFVADSNN